MVLCCEIFTDHSHYLHIFLEIREENYKQTVLSVDYAQGIEQCYLLFDASLKITYVINPPAKISTQYQNT